MYIILLPRWFQNQLYVNEVDAEKVLDGFKRNGKHGVTISILKRGGWQNAFTCATKMACWDE